MASPHVTPLHPVLPEVLHLLERSDLLIEVSVLFCSTRDHSSSACGSLPQEAGKLPEAMDEKKYVDAVVVSPPGSTDPVLKPSSAILPAT